MTVSIAPGQESAPPAPSTVFTSMPGGGTGEEQVITIRDERRNEEGTSDGPEPSTMNGDGVVVGFVEEGAGTATGPHTDHVIHLNPSSIGNYVTTGGGGGPMNRRGSDASSLASSFAANNRRGSGDSSYNRRGSGDSGWNSSSLNRRGSNDSSYGSPHHHANSRGYSGSGLVTFNRRGSGDPGFAAHNRRGSGDSSYVASRSIGNGTTYSYTAQTTQTSVSGSDADGGVIGINGELSTAPGDMSISSDESSNDSANMFLRGARRGSRSGASEDLSNVDDEDEELAGREDTKMAANLRVVVILLFIGMAISVPSIVYTATRNNQRETFEATFYSLAGKAVDGMESQFAKKVSAIDSLRISITSYALNTNATWPNILIPDFDLRGDSVRDLADTLLVGFHPLVTSETRQAWEEFVATNAKVWINQAQSRDVGAKPNDRRLSQRTLSIVPQRQGGNSEVAISRNSTQNLTSLHDDITTLPIHDGNSTKAPPPESSTAMKTLTFDDMGISHEIFKLDSSAPDGFSIDDTDGPFFPFWQVMPTITNVINFNAFSHPYSQKALISASNTGGECVISRIENASLYGPVGEQAMHSIFTSAMKKITGDANATYHGEPLSFLYCPVFDSFQEPLQYQPYFAAKHLVGMLSTLINFKQMFLEVLPPGNKKDLICVVSSACGDIFSYRLTRDDAEYLGPIDAHDAKFDGMQKTLDFTIAGVSYCPYEMRVYPSIAFHDNHVTRQPIIYSVSMGLVVLFISIVSLTYDFYVQKRMKRVLKSAKESRAIVSSLFPAKVRDRLLKEEEEAQKQREALERSQNESGFGLAINIVGVAGSLGGGTSGGGGSSVGGGSRRANRRASVSERRASVSERRGSGDDRLPVDSNHTSHAGLFNGRRGSGSNHASGDCSKGRSSNERSNRRNSNDRDSLFADMFPISAAKAGLGAFAQLAPAKMRLKFFLHEGRQSDYPQSRSSGDGEGRGRGSEDAHPQTDGEDQDMVLHAKPIADLFPHCTVLFSDISGFTAWSSEREPEQVFTLLQTIFQTFDHLARKRAIFKVETIGDCYVAVTGLPDPQPDHAIRMTRFARACMHKVAVVTRKLEVTLGPGTGDLRMRFGLHSGPVTAGVLRGEKSRFQLFGDTVNTASRMESTGLTNRIQISQSTAQLLLEAGKGAWIVPREDLVHAKGKGSVQTYWVITARRSCNPELDSNGQPIVSGGPRFIQSNLASFAIDENTDHGSIASGNYWGEEFDDEHRRDTNNVVDYPNMSQKIQVSRLIDWQTDLLLRLLTQIVAGREASSSEPIKNPDQLINRKDTVLEEVSECIFLPKFDPKAAKARVRPDAVELPSEVVSQLREYVALIAERYRSNPFHNFSHCCHVTMSANKLLSRIVKPEDVNYHRKSVKAIVSDLHQYTYGITSDSLTQFAVMFSALIHDVDHTGVSNGQLSVENPALAEKYKSRSVAEQNSVDIAWNLLMDPKFESLQQAIFANESELLRFRQLLVNIVMATDIFDKDMKTTRNMRWERVFHSELPEESKGELTHLKATIVIEHIIQAADVAHTMQHWQVYTRWNERLFQEMYLAYKSGRSEKDPSEGWYNGELWFFDNYVIPLARKLEECGVFGVASEECLNYALENRKEWAVKGKELVKEMLERCKMLNVNSDAGLANQTEEVTFSPSVASEPREEEDDDDDDDEEEVNADSPPSTYKRQQRDEGILDEMMEPDSGPNEKVLDHVPSSLDDSIISC